MSRLKNDRSFDCPELLGLTVQSFVGFYDGSIENGVDMLVLELNEVELCQRFFLDAGIGFWEEMSKDEAIFDYSDSNELNIAEALGLKDKKITSIYCYGSNGSMSEFNFEFDSVRLKLKYLDSEDVNSENTVLVYEH